MLCFLRSIFQANEYDQIFEPTIDYLDPVAYGFEAHKGGLRPVLNLSRQSEQQQQVTVTNVDPTLLEGVVNNSIASIHDMSCSCIEPDQLPNPTDPFNAETETCLTRDSLLLALSNASLGPLNPSEILNATLSQHVDSETEETISASVSNDSNDLFTFEEWLDIRD